MANRALQWFTSISDAQTVTSGGQSANELLAGLSDTLRKGSTITRIIMQLVLHAGTVDTTFGRVKYGIVLMNQDAVSAGAFPDADVATDNVDWLVRGAEVVSATSLTDSSQFVSVFRDLRAQRMLRTGQELLEFIIDQSTSGQVIGYDLFTRILVRLP